MSERVLAGQEKFSSQFSQRSLNQAQSPPSAQFSRTDDFGRFGDPDEEFNANPLDFNDDIDRMEPPKSPPPLQLRRDANGPQENSAAPPLSDVNRPVGFPDNNSNIPERAIDSASGQSRELSYTEKRLFDEIEDIKAQNNEILRRIQRLEARLR